MKPAALLALAALIAAWWLATRRQPAAVTMLDRWADVEADPHLMALVVQLAADRARRDAWLARN